MSKQRYQIKATIFDKKGRVLSVGENSYDKTHPFQAKYATEVGLPHKIYLHAEVHAIIRVRGRGKPYKIKVERYDSFGRPLKAKPCPLCEKAIRDCGIEQVEWTT